MIDTSITRGAQGRVSVSSRNGRVTATAHPATRRKYETRFLRAGRHAVRVRGHRRRRLALVGEDRLGKRARTRASRSQSRRSGPQVGQTELSRDQPLGRRSFRSGSAAIVDNAHRRRPSSGSGARERPAHAAILIWGDVTPRTILAWECVTGLRVRSTARDSLVTRHVRDASAPRTTTDESAATGGVTGASALPNPRGSSSESGAGRGLAQRPHLRSPNWCDDFV